MSDQDNDMFKGGESTDTPPNTQNQADPLDLIKREDGSRKYDSYDKLAVGYVNAEKHIKELQAKLDAMAQGKERTAVEAALEKLLANQNKAPETPNVPAGLSKEDVIALLGQVEAEKSAKGNINAVRTDLVKAAGGEEAAAKLFREKATELGISTADLTNLSARSPAAVRKLLGLGERSTAPSKSISTINPGGIPPAPAERKRVLLGGATTADIMAEWHAAKPQ